MPGKTSFKNTYGQYHVDKIILKDGYTSRGFIAFDFEDIITSNRIILDTSSRMQHDIENLCPQPFRSMRRNTTANIGEDRREAKDIEYTFELGISDYSERFIKIFFSAFCYAVLSFEDNMTNDLNSQLKADIRLIAAYILTKSLDQNMESLCKQLGLEVDYQKYIQQFPSQNPTSTKTNLVEAVYGVNIQISDAALMQAAAKKIEALRSQPDKDQTVQATLYLKMPR